MAYSREKQMALEGALHEALAERFPNLEERHELVFHLSEIILDCYPVFEAVREGRALGEEAERLAEAPVVHWPYHLRHLWKIVSKHALVDVEPEVLQLK